MIFTDRERDYLAGQGLGRLATIGPDGTPHVRPVGFRLNEDDTIDIGGPNLRSSQKYRNVRTDPKVSFIADDLTPDEPGAIRPGWGRGVEIRGLAELLETDRPLAPGFSDEVIRVHARRVLSLNLDAPGSQARDIERGADS
ncbi:PPOX class F420-dependent oxidoreductase [Amycolatopsis anabasis]|uniref:PPOX class F420-dependent oxidoreductase n=1 Tax=Amycolatopsis anabasis TaxID=1840409 RepID=UPI00131D4D59|nr:PPOX class F420-dependent oxidoreductase [Amycolatopsis anabasis]